MCVALQWIPPRVDTAGLKVADRAAAAGFTTPARHLIQHSYNAQIKGRNRLCANPTAGYKFERDDTLQLRWSEETFFPV